MTHATQPIAQSAQAPRPPKPDYAAVFLEPVYEGFDPSDDNFDSDHSHTEA